MILIKKDFLFGNLRNWVFLYQNFVEFTMLKELLSLGGKILLKKYEKKEGLEEAISSYVRFYTEERLQENLGERSPLEYRKFNE